MALVRFSPLCHTLFRNIQCLISGPQMRFSYPMKYQYFNSKRYQSSEECQAALDKPSPKCGELFKKRPCDSKSQQTKVVIKQAKVKPLPPKEKEIKIKRPDVCCGNPCSNALARFDLLYYRRSDKLSRKYQQTWAECPDVKKVPKVICQFDNIQYPKLEKRPRNERPKTACTPPVCTNTQGNCPRVHMPRCGKARLPPKCHVNRGPKVCHKRKAPYPCFAECKLPAKPRRAIECKCLALAPMCEVWARYHQMRSIKAKSKC